MRDTCHYHYAANSYSELFRTLRGRYYSSKVTYALVNKKAGTAVLKDIKINEKSILELLPPKQ